MRALITTLLIICSLGLTFAASAAEPDFTARLLVSNPSPYLGEEIDLLLEVTYNGHPGGRTRFHWPKLDNFVAADLTAVRSKRGRDGQNRLVETITRRIRPLLTGTFLLQEAIVVSGNQNIELQPLTLRVRPLPTTGKPENFEDQVGNYRLTLAAGGAGPREVSLHIYDSNQLATVPNIMAWPGSGERLIPIDTKTRTAGTDGREHILRYFYAPADGEKGELRFSLTVYDPQQQSYLEVETGPAAKPATATLIIIILSGLTLFSVGFAFLQLRRHPRTVAGCLQRLCRRPVTGLSREKIQDLLQPYLDNDELEVLNSYWQNEDAFHFNQNRPTGEPDVSLSTKNLRRSLWKAIDKQQHIP